VNKNGLTLIEVMITMFLVIILFGAVFSVFTSVHKALALSENYLNASRVGRNILNEAYVAGFDNVMPLTGTYSYTGQNEGRNLIRSFNYNLNISSIDPDRKLLWVTVNWNDSGKIRQVVLETMLVRR